MTALKASTFLWLAVLLLVSSCAGQGASPAAADGSDTSMPEPDGTSDELDPILDPSNLPFPSGFVLPPIVNPDGSGPPYQAGEPVRAGGATITYERTRLVDGRYVASFRLSGKLPQPVRDLYLVSSGQSVALAIEGDTATTQPFRLDSPPDSSTLIAWQVGSEVLVWQLGDVK
jgi:hypothetical protein